ncbi:putative short-chain dehydrogenase [Lipomyces doorenjongii]
MVHQDSGIAGITGKAFIITGGQRGIGFAFACSLLKAGAKVGVLDLPEKPDPAFESVQKEYQDGCFYSRADVTDQQSLYGALETLSRSLGGIDGCITAAGICIDKPFEEHTWIDFQKQSSVNGAGTFFTVQWVVERLKKAGKPGSILMIASQAARHVCPGHLLAAYASSKGGVLAFARNLAVELAGNGIRVNTISPGYIATEMNLSLARQRPELHEIFQNAPPLKRMGTVDDLIGGLLYLLSDSASYLTGVDLPIDGGMCVSVSNGR